MNLKGFKGKGKREKGKIHVLSEELRVKNPIAKGIIKTDKKWNGQKNC